MYKLISFIKIYQLKAETCNYFTNISKFDYINIGKIKRIDIGSDVAWHLSSSTSKSTLNGTKSKRMTKNTEFKNIKYHNEIAKSLNNVNSHNKIKIVVQDDEPPTGVIY